MSTENVTQIKEIYCAILHNGKGDLFLSEGKKGYLTAFTMRVPDAPHNPPETITQRIKEKGISQKIVISNEPDCEFLLDDSGTQLKVHAFMRKVKETDFEENFEFFTISHKALRQHWNTHRTEYRTANGLIVPVSAVKAGASISAFLRNSNN